MLARIRVGDRRFIAAASGPRNARGLAAHDAWVLRALDLTACGIEAACPRKGAGWRLPDSGQPSLSPS